MIDAEVLSPLVLRVDGRPVRLGPMLRAVGTAGRQVRIGERAPPSWAGTDVLAALLKPVQ